MINLSDKTDCCGCGACENACPNGCIVMRPDDEEFLYPVVDESKCVGCEICKNVCPILNHKKSDNKFEALGGYSVDAEAVSKSSSGGLFYSMSKWIIEQGGVVFGAAFDDKFVLRTQKAETLGELSPLMKSKYVQTATGDAYSQIKELLDVGRKVLYCSTGCHIEGLLHFLGKEYDNLYVVDFVCHGTVSPKVWQKYLNRVSEQYAKAVKTVNFRDKRNGWENNNICITFEDGSEFVEPNRENAYMRAFLSGLSMRPSCFNCRFKGENRNSDVTIADLWGAKYQCPDGYNINGTSLALVHSAKGMELLDKCKESLKLVSAPMPASVAFNESLYKSTRCPEGRQEFFEKYETEQFDMLVDRLMPKQTVKSEGKTNAFVSLLKRVLNKIKRMLKR